MSRNLLLLSLVFVAAAAVAQPKPGGQDAPEGGNLNPSPTEDAVCPKGGPCAKIAWDEKSRDYGAFFRYQGYIAKIGGQAETKDSWDKLSAEDQRKKLNEQNAFIRTRFSQLIKKSPLSNDDTDFLKTVFGPDIAQGVGQVAAARGRDNLDDATKQAMIQKAVASLQKTTAKIGGLTGDLDKLFDAASKRGGGDAVAVEEESVIRQKPRSNFLDSLSSPEITKPLESRASFKAYLEAKVKSQDVAPQAIPGMLAMYEVLSKAPKEEKAQMAHLLPTVIRFLEDGKTIALENHEGALGVAVPGDYDQPQKVAVTPLVEKADPAVVGKTLAHEFQHIYDMYVGRYYTIDSEMRGFKVAALYFEAMEKSTPKDYAALRNGDNDATRGIMADAERYRGALKKGEQEFFQSVAFGHGYNQWHEGVFMGRAPLREAVDPKLGAPRELASRRAEVTQIKTELGSLEKRQAELRESLKTKKSRELEKEFDKVTKDLSGLRMYVVSLEQRADMQERRVRRMQSNVEWLDDPKRNRGKTPPQFDMELAVDKEYMVP